MILNRATRRPAAHRRGRVQVAQHVNTTSDLPPVPAPEAFKRPGLLQVEETKLPPVVDTAEQVEYGAQI